jgi:site-specific DNA recombinase
MATVAVGYIRASTTDQTLTPEAQQSRIINWCASNSYSLACMESDLGESGAKEWAERPALASAIAHLQSIKDAGDTPVLVVASRCRLARSTMVAAGIYMLCEEIGAKVEAADGIANGNSPEDILFRTILDAFNQYERARIVLRTRAGREVKRRRGEYLGGGVPYGLRIGEDGRTLVKDESEQQAMLYASEKRALGWSYAAIGENMEVIGLMPRKGSRWTSQAVRRLVSRAVKSTETKQEV